MIDSKELRIGNWVNCYDFTFQIGELLTDYACDISGKEGAFFYDKMTPIELSPDILEKAGFDATENNWFGKKYFTDCNESAEVMYINYNVKSGRCYIYDIDNGGDGAAIIGKSIKYLHQLQNLYHALTQTELIITDL